MLAQGTKAPNFKLSSGPDQIIKLSDHLGKRIILAFYPADWSPVCSDQMALYNETKPIFERHNAEILGISVDSKWCHAAFSKDRNLHFPLLADFEPKGAVARSYGVYDEASGTTQRALFVIDETGTIAWAYASPTDQNPGADGILEALEKLDQININKS
jgi:peroxiredoxin